MVDIFLLKIITESNKRFILKLNPNCSINEFILEVKKYFLHYYNILYTIKFIFTPDKFAILDNLELTVFFKSGEICYIKGNEVEIVHRDVNIDKKVNYDIFNKQKKRKNSVQEPMILGSGLKNLETNIKISETNTTLKSPPNLVKDNEKTLEIEKKQIKKKNNKDERNFNIKNGINPNLQNNKDERNFNIKNGINPNLQNNKDERNVNIKNGINPNLQNNKDERNFNIKNGINPNLQNDESDKKLFNIEEINIKPKEKSTVELKGIKQIKKKKKINYDDL